MRYRCLVLDHDETAVSSTSIIHYPAHLEVMKKIRPDVKPVDLDGWFLKNFHPGIMEYLVNELGFTDHEMEEEGRIWHRFMASGMPRFFPGFIEALRTYREAGGYITVVSHSEEQMILRHYSTAGFEPDAVFGWSEDASRRKPSTWPVLRIMERLEVRAEDILLVDDLKPGIVMAKRAGVAAAAAGWAHRVPEIERYMRRNTAVYLESVDDFRRYILT